MAGPLPRNPGFRLRRLDGAPYQPALNKEAGVGCADSDIVAASRTVWSLRPKSLGFMLRSLNPYLAFVLVLLASPIAGQMPSWGALLYGTSPLPLRFGDFGLRDCGLKAPRQLVLVPLPADDDSAMVRTFINGVDSNIALDLRVPSGGEPFAVEFAALWCTHDNEPAVLYVQRAHVDGLRVSRLLIPLDAFPGEISAPWRDFVRVFDQGALVAPVVRRQNIRNWDILRPSEASGGA